MRVLNLLFESLSFNSLVDCLVLQKTRVFFPAPKSFLSSKNFELSSTLSTSCFRFSESLSPKEKVLIFSNSPMYFPTSSSKWEGKCTQKKSFCAFSGTLLRIFLVFSASAYSKSKSASSRTTNLTCSSFAWPEAIKSKTLSGVPTITFAPLSSNSFCLLSGVPPYATTTLKGISAPIFLKSFPT